MPAAMTKANGAMKIEEIIHNEPPRLLILFDKGQEEITRVVADILGYTYRLLDRIDGAYGWSHEAVLGLENDFITAPESLRHIQRTLITAHCIDIQDRRDEELTTFCD